MNPTDLIFWIAPLADADAVDAMVLCQRHADAMVVPRGWTLHDRRENSLRLFATGLDHAAPPRRPRRPSRPRAERPEQLQIDGTGEIPRPSVAELPPDGAAGEEPVSAEVEGPPTSWSPDFDPDDDLAGLLQVSSPLLSRAFRGTDRPRR